MIPGFVEKPVSATPLGHACAAQPTLYESAQTFFMDRKQRGFIGLCELVSDSAVSGSESVPVCSGRILLCTVLYHNHNIGPPHSTTALQIQV